ncbi:MAG TPA: DNA-directed RNA polymerase subunit omega [Desulfobacterales bacterium]
MARITVEDCLKKVPNRFLLVNMVAKRVRQIREGSEYLISSPKNEDIVISLREVAAGKVQLRTESRPEALPEPEPEASEEEVQEAGAPETAEAAEPEAPPAEDSEETATEE